MVGQDRDPIAGLEGKLSDLAAALTDDERAVFLDIVNRAAVVEPEVAGLTMNFKSADPCEGGEVFDPHVFEMLNRLSVKFGPEFTRHKPGSGKAKG